ncbi:MAG: hypothetical protein EOP47_08410 [Sphingobacteriaceae bacterium]|nr:MAG: hypothetical protein EOP47_08410 [Sphingobacteriaceae bacterium]
MMKKLHLLLTVLVISNIAIAQKLPNIQVASLRAPANIKIDGKATEWNNQFQAYNKNTEVFYTVSNDDNNIYFTIQVTQARVIEKIMNAGVSIIVNSVGEKTDKSLGNVSFTFPLMDYQNVPRIVTDAGAKTKDIIYSTGPGSRDIYKSEFETKSSDSLKAAATKLLNLSAKTIQVKGIKEIPDGDISVYNEERIKVGAAFDNTGAYTYELAVPLKYTGLSVKDIRKFSYSITLQSRQNVLRRGMVTRYSYINGQRINMDQDLDSTTDLWGEYTLAK